MGNEGEHEKTTHADLDHGANYNSCICQGKRGGMAVQSRMLMRRKMRLRHALIFKTAANEHGGLMRRCTRQFENIESLIPS